MEMKSIEYSVSDVDHTNDQQHTDQNFQQTKDNNRISTGISKLDELLTGGYPKGRVILVSGTPGSGKTIVCFHYINAGVENNEKCLYLSTDEHVDSLLNEALAFGFDFQDAVDRKQLKFMFINTEKNNIHQMIEEEVRSGGYDRVVLDSLSPLAEKPIWIVNNGNEVVPQESAMTSTTIPLDSIQATRLHLRKVISIFKDCKMSTLLTSEIPDGSRNLSRDSVSEFLSDGIILLDMDMSMDRRKLMIRKMRKTCHTLKPQNIVITDNGIQLS